ncbi:hypothetical protein GA0061083_3940 [Pseudarthrobacter enclensis]|nr:hypothetical protein GA0061083_3940 [Pseudarthrobacter enclensis]
MVTYQEFGFISCGARAFLPGYTLAHAGSGGLIGAIAGAVRASA